MEKEKVSVLVDAGLKKVEAKVLLYLFEHKKTVTRSIEREMFLRQPSVCNALSGFLKKGWVSKNQKEKNGGRGRPETVFTLVKKKEEMIDDMKEQLRQRSIQIDKSLEKLDKLF